MRLGARGQSPWLPTDAVLAGLLVSLLLAAPAFASGGAAALWLFVAQAAWAVALLEIVNCIERRPLRRRRFGARHEQAAPEHSWNADFAVSNGLLFNRQLHPDHHAHMQRPYERLRSALRAPQGPASYPAMVLAALLPSRSLRLMDALLPAEPATA